MSVVERTFGMLKVHWRIALKKVGQKTSILKKTMIFLLREFCTTIVCIVSITEDKRLDKDNYFDAKSLKMSTMAFVCSICLLWASRNISADRSNLALSCSILFSHISIKELCMPIWSRTFSPFFTQDVEIGEVFFNFLNSIFHSRARSLPELLEFTRILDSAAVSSPAVSFSGFLDTFLYTKNRYRSTFLFFSL